jgi:TolA-binding protein
MRFHLSKFALVLGGLCLASPGPVARAQDDMGFDLSGDETKKKDPKKVPKKDPKKDPRKDPRKDPKKGDAKAQGGDDGGFGFEALDVSVKSAEKEAMETALDLMKDEKYDPAAVSFWELYNNPRAKQYFQSSEYQLAKALYRMRMYHSALQHFGQILEKGTEHKYFKTSLEWLFFISHKVKDQREVLDYIARYSDVEFPKKYRDEFLFLLAKNFYFRALDVEKGAAPAPATKPAPAPGGRKAAEDEMGFDLGGGDDIGLDLGGGDSGLDLSGGGGLDLSAGDELGLDLGGKKKAGPSTLPTDAVGLLSKSRALLLQVSETSKFYPRARYLEAIISYKEENFQEASEAFRKVVRLLHPKTGKFRDDALREMAFFQLARTHYAHKQFRYALFYYDRVNHDSIEWLDALFESSWAWFRLGKFQKALGNLITLDSPFFRDEYFPEGLVLKAVTYFENCRYPESNQIVAEFRARYEPLYKELDKLVSQKMEPEAYYKKLLAIQTAPTDDASGKLLRRILKVALADDDLKVLNASVLEIEREMARIRKRPASFTGSKLSKRLLDLLQGQRDKLVRKAGELTQRRLAQERDFLASLIGQALRIKLENDGAELEMLRKAKSGDLDLGPTLLEYEWSAATDDEKLYWPYQGEFWRDELGTYEYTLTWGCRKQAE